MAATTELKSIVQGESTYPIFTYLDKTGTVVNLDDVIDIQVLFKSDSTGEIFSKYSKEVATGWNSTDFVIIDAEKGEFGIKIQSTETLKWGLGIVDVEIKVKENISGFTPDFRSIYLERLYICGASKISKL